MNSSVSILKPDKDYPGVYCYSIKETYLINEQNETECEYWACNNLHTRCNCFWNCDDGTDEFHCDASL
ncbi:unnamed protein product, partial [Adineta steineri]